MLLAAQATIRTAASLATSRSALGLNLAHRSDAAGEPDEGRYSQDKVQQFPKVLRGAIVAPSRVCSQREVRGMKAPMLQRVISKRMEAQLEAIRAEFARPSPKPRVRVTDQAVAALCGRRRYDDLKVARKPDWRPPVPP